MASFLAVGMVTVKEVVPELHSGQGQFASGSINIFSHSDSMKGGDINLRAGVADSHPSNSKLVAQYL